MTTPSNDWWDVPLPPPEAFTRLCDAAGAGVAARASGDASGGGRGLFATADAPRGATLFVERPALLVQDPSNRASVPSCAACHTLLPPPSPSPSSSPSPRDVRVRLGMRRALLRRAMPRRARAPRPSRPLRRTPRLVGTPDRSPKTRGSAGRTRRRRSRPGRRGVRPMPLRRVLVPVVELALSLGPGARRARRRKSSLVRARGVVGTLRRWTTR